MQHDESLIGWWPLERDAAERIASADAALVRDVAFARIASPTGARQAAVFNGRTSLIETAMSGARLGAGPFAISMWVHSQASEGEVIGDLVTCFDADARRGFTLSVVTNNGVTSSPLANDRHAHFGVDADLADARWFDHGRPGNAVMVMALHVHDGRLYAGTFEAGAGQTGHLWRYEGEGRWHDMGGCPDGSNAVPAVTHLNGQLYCCTGRYDPRGSALEPAKNPAPGGRVYRIDEDGGWTDCGLVGAHGARPDHEPAEGYFTDKADDTTGLMPFRGELLAISNHRRGVWRWDGKTGWDRIGPDARLFSLTVFQGGLYAMVNGGPILRYAGDGAWDDCGQPETSRQTYSAAIIQDRMYVGTWPEGEVYRYEGGTDWLRLPRLGYEREVMGMAVYNGKLYAGSLPMAHVFRMDGGWFSFVGNLDDAEVPLRRVWSMAVFRGRLFAGTLPQGRVRSFQAGAMATADRPLEPGWRHIAAVRDAGQLRLYVDGELAGVSAGFDRSAFDVACGQPLRLGAGSHATLNGALADVRLYSRALDPIEISQLATAAAPQPAG